MDNPLAPFKYCPRCGSNDCQTPKGERSLRCPECGLSYYANVASAVAGFVINKGGEILSVRRGREPARGTLDLPGGFVDPMETVEQAMLRELVEETSLRAIGVTYLWSLPNIYPYSGIDIYTSDLFFLVRVESFDLAIASDDAAEIVVQSIQSLKADDYGLISIRQAIDKFQQEWESGVYNSLI